MKYNLSEITEIIRNRRSISPEQFSNRKVHREQIETMLQNATWAPTHGMTQPWRFHVFMEAGRQQLLQFLPELYKSSTPTEKFNQTKYDRLAERLQHVTAIVVVAMHRDETKKIKEVEEIEAVACAIQNMSLTATAYGLSCYWSSPGYIYTDAMKSFLKLDPDDQCLGICYLGYPQNEWPKSHRKPIEYSTHWITE
jgi:nitroreductase